MAMQTSPSSPLLALPKELRLLIYEALYPVQSPNNEKEIDISTAEPPPKALLLSCKQIHHEAKALYVISFRDYWSSSHFVLHHNAQAPKTISREVILSLPMREMQHINHLRILTSGAQPPEISSAYLVHPKGGWGFTNCAGTQWFRRYRVWIWRSHSRAGSVVVPTKAAWDGHGNEEDLRKTCERIACKVPMVNQVLHLLDLELEYLEGVWQNW